MNTYSIRNKTIFSSSYLVLYRHMHCVKNTNKILQNHYLYGWGAPAALTLVFMPGGGLGIMPIGGVLGPMPGVTGLPVGGTIIPPGDTCGTMGFRFLPMLTADTSVCKSATDDVCPMPTRAPVSTSHSSRALDTRSNTWLTTLLNAASCFCAVSNCRPPALCSTCRIDDDRRTCQAAVDGGQIRKIRTKIKRPTVVRPYLHQFVFDLGLGFGAQEVGHDVVGQGGHSVLGDARQLLVPLRVQHQRQHAVVAQLRQLLVRQVLGDGRVLRGEHRERVQHRGPAHIVPLVFQLEYERIDLRLELVQLGLEVFQHQFQLLVLALHLSARPTVAPNTTLFTSRHTVVRSVRGTTARHASRPPPTWSCPGGSAL